MHKKLLVAHAEGLGNCIEIIPCLRTIKEVLGYKIDMWHAFGTFKIPNIIPYVDKWFVGKDRNKINISDYSGIVSTFWTRNKIAFFLNKGMKLLNEIMPLTMNRSEVDTYMDIARNLGVKEEDIIWHGECNYTKSSENYDIVVHNGYNSKGVSDWKIKSYPYYEDVVNKLIVEGFSVCSIGSGSEYIKGTVNKTGLNLLSSMGFIKNSKLFLGNDSGLYHCANALSVKNVVIFTATSITKNYDKRVHKYSTILGRDDLKCRPCQSGRGWKNCKTWECREIDPDVVLSEIKRVIK